MEKREFIEKLRELVQSEDLIAVSSDANEVKTKFNDLILEEERQHQVKHLEEHGPEVPMEPYFDKLNDEFFEVYADFKTRRKEQIEAKKAEENENLKKKRTLIERLRAVISEEENIGTAFSIQKEIQESWKEIGDIAREKRQEIQNEYSRLMEEFFYNMKIYKELKEHDLRRNQQLKTEIIEKLKKLTDQPVIKEIETELKALQHEWEEIGPTFQAEWESIKEEYWSIVKSVYERIKAHYDEKRLEMSKNIELKKDLISKAEAVYAKVQESSSHKDWDTLTAELLALQEEWKTVGFGPRKENEEVWAEFRAVCDRFFAEKKEFYKERQFEYDGIKEQKEALIAQVNELKLSTDWKNTSHKIVSIQKEWKKIGGAGPRYEQKLWKDFRSACDAFFNAKQAHFDALDKANEDNLVKKEDLIKRIEEYVASEDKKDVLEVLKNFAQEFNEIGNVPFKEKDRIYKAFKTALDKHYADLNLKGAEKEQVMFTAKLDTIVSSPDASRLLQEERRSLTQQIQKLEQERRQFENNLGFFASSKGADSLKKEVEKKIAAADKKIEDLKTKLDMIPYE
jgi:hypothetical protein